MKPDGTSTAGEIELSFVIPLFNAAATIRAVVEEIHSACDGIRFEIVLVNDGSSDQTEFVCQQLFDAYPDHVVFVQLARNFGELGAVMAGLHRARGAYVAIMDDDGQHPPSEALKLYEHCRKDRLDVVYGRYRTKEHGPLRNLASRFYNAMALVLIGKPRGLYLSSFKVMNRFVVDAIKSYESAPPYIDGLILRTTRSLAQIDVSHRPRLTGESNYTLRGLAWSWVGILLSFSVVPLRAAGILGFICAFATAPMLLFIIIDKLWITPNLTFGIPTVLCTMIFFSGVQLLILGVFGEYLGRLYEAGAGSPRFVIRYEQRHGGAAH